MNKNKVYCVNCKHFKSFHPSGDECFSINNLKDTFYKEKDEKFLSPCVKNKNNDCKDFQPKVGFFQSLKKLYKGILKCGS